MESHHDGEESKGLFIRSCRGGGGRRGRGGVQKEVAAGRGVARKPARCKSSANVNQSGEKQIRAFSVTKVVA
jgi:hypothetical protein